MMVVMNVVYVPPCHVILLFIYQELVESSCVLAALKSIGLCGNNQTASPFSASSTKKNHYEVTITFSITVDMGKKRTKTKRKGGASDTLSRQAGTMAYLFLR